MTSPTLNSAAGTAKPASASLYSLMGADGGGGATDEEETTNLIAAHCNTLPRVIVSTGGRSATITAANAFATAERCKAARHNGGDNNNRLTMFSAAGPAAATLRRDSAGGVTMTSHALMGGDPAVDKYLECLWQPSVAAAASNNGRHQQQMSTVSGNLGDGNVGRMSRYNSHDLLQHHHLQQQQQHQQHHPQSGITSVSSVLLQPPRTCLERVVFALLTLVLVIIFLVAALVFLYLGSGVGGLDGGYGGPYDGGGGRDADLPSVEAAGLNVEDGIDIVRIKTTEEVVSGLK